MKYMGSKNRIAKYILPIILKDRKEGQIFFDVCCGGGNVLDKVDNPRIGVDSNEYLIEALKLIRDWPDTLPKNNIETDEETYKQMKDSENKALKGYYGFALSYGGKWFGGWRRDSQGKRDYVAEAYKNALKQSKKLQGAIFICANYDEIEYTPGSIIYVDPPYQNTTKYKDFFDYDKFWDWCRKMSKENQIFISEYIAPDDFECIWQKEIVSSLTKNTGSKKGIEKLFIKKCT
jgi:DNA adenine methylase